MIKHVSLLIILLSSITVFALQKPSCELLDDADVIGDLNILDLYTGTMIDTLVLPVPSPLCLNNGSSSAHNMTWFSFVAGSGNYSIEIIPNNCIAGEGGGTIGLQSGIYTDCTFSEAVVCNSDCSTSAVVLNCNDLTPGLVYYFFLDGCQGTVCEFQINILGDYSVFTGIPEPTGLKCATDCGPVSIGHQRNIIVEGLDLAIDYYWIIPNEVEVIDPMIPTNLTTENNIDLLFNTEGTYTICLDYATNGAFQTNNQVCKDITVINDFIANATATNETSFAANDGTATCMPNGSGYYQFTWSNGENTQEIVNLMPGDYIVTVNDIDLNIQAIDTITVDAFMCDTIIYESNISNNNCFAVCEGIVTILNVQNGTGPYSYLWSNGQSTNEIIGLCAGDYQVTITDDNNCPLVSEMITIEQPNILLVNAEADNTSAIALPSGGTEPYTYMWSNGDTSQTITDLMAGVYTIIVEDSNGCQATESVITDIQFSIDNIINITNNDFGAIYISANTNNAIYDWTGPNGFSSSEEDIINLTDAGCYTVHLTDSIIQFSKDTTICISDLTGIVNEKEIIELSIYPVPTSDFITIEFSTIVTDVDTRIYNLAGQLEYNNKLKVTDSNSIQIDVSELNNGIHFIELSTSNSTYRGKIIIKD